MSHSPCNCTNFCLGVDTEVAQKVTDKFGRYYALVPDTGEYYVTIERKNPDESYTQVFKSEPIVAAKGLLIGSLRSRSENDEDTEARRLNVLV